MVKPVTIEQMICEGSCTAAWAQQAGYRWDAVVVGGDALAKREEWLARQASHSSENNQEKLMSGNDNTSDCEAMFSTAGQLRELLEGIPSEAEVSVSALPGKQEPVSMALLLSVGDRPIEPWATCNMNRGSVTHVTVCEVGPVNDDETS